MCVINYLNRFSNRGVWLHLIAFCLACHATAAAIVINLL